MRELKAKGNKNVWQPEVDILLTLKQKLAVLSGKPNSTDAKAKKKK